MRLTLALPAALVALGLLAGPAHAAEADPVAPAPAPTTVEGFSPYLGQVSCDPRPKPGTEALAELILRTYGGRSLGIGRACDIGGVSEHKEGRAFDWGRNASVPAERATADRFLAWLLAPGEDGVAAYNARRLGIMYVIWNARIWSAHRAASGWLAYGGRNPHTGHVHISLAWNGAMKRTSFWTGEAAPVDYGPCREYTGLLAPAYTSPRLTRCPAPVSPMTLTGSPVLEAGSTGPYVAQLQIRLKTPVDGTFGSRTTEALIAYQRAAGLPATGRTDQATWDRLRAPAATTPTRAAPVAARSSAALAPYAGLTLREGARGPAVVALQRALGVTADGVFGPKTASAVNAFHTASGLPADGVVRPATWRALGAPATPAGKAAGKSRRWVPAPRR